jgi:hypothetical protein
LTFSPARRYPEDNVRIHNLLPHFLECMQRWKTPPGLRDFSECYYRHVERFLEGTFFDDPADLHAALEDLHWDVYRTEALTLDPAQEEARVRRHLESIEKTFGFSLAGDIVLFGAFARMDGFARFERGTHRVLLGVDESHGRGAYLDVLVTHELTHVTRESRPEVWTGWGLDPKMERETYFESQPVIEHVFGEGFSCAISELLVPGQPPWAYAYQTQDSLAQVLRYGPALDRRIHAEIQKAHAESEYTSLYDPDEYDAPVPPYAHYVWAWQWAKKLLRERAGGDPRKLVAVSSKELMESALEFRLEKIS